MSNIIWEKLKDDSGTRYWLLFEHGRFHQPTMVIDHYQMRELTKEVLHSIMSEDIPELLKVHRRRQGFTQAEVAEHLGISRNYVSMIERGTAENLTIKVYERIINYLMEYD